MKELSTEADEKVRNPVAIAEKLPLITEIKGNSLDDGPGIRSVIFFKGCPLDCVWCQNPETKSPHLELSFDPDKCIGARECIKACPEDVISPRNKFYVDRGKCTLCGECVKACPSEAFTFVGRYYEVEEVVEIVSKDKTFYEVSGGGVTLSGGEPLMFLDYVHELVKKLKEKGLHILVETGGVFNLEKFLELVYPYIDVIYMDIKIFDGELHQKYAGVDNKIILENFTILNEKYLDGGVEILPRTPLIPGITDSDENLTAIAKFLKERKVPKVELLPYNPTWVPKLFKLGKDSPYKNEQWMPQERVEECKEIFRKEGLDTI